MMATFILKEWAFAVGCLLLFGLCGAGFVRPFSGLFRMQTLAAPFAGLLAVPFGANTVYSLLNWPYPKSLAISLAACASLGLLAVVRERPACVTDWLTTTASIALAAGIAVLIYDSATIKSVGPAIYYKWGTDHAGYAHLADWLNSYPVSAQPNRLATADEPYASWPALMFGIDPRFGSFGLLASLSDLHGTSGLFTYDIACAVVAAASVLALAAVFSASRLAFFLVVLGLFVAHWFEYAHTGFFGKFVAYPAALFIAGLSLCSFRAPTVERLIYISFLAASAGIMHSGLTIAVISGSVLGAALCSILIAERMDWPIAVRKSTTGSMFTVAGVAVLSPIIASGIAARPTYLGYPSWNFAWEIGLLRLFDLDALFWHVNGLGISLQYLLLALATVTHAALIVQGIVTRNAVAIGLAAGPVVLLFALFCCGLQNEAYQLTGFAYPALVCAGGSLVINVHHRIALVLVVLAIAERAPRFTGALELLCLNQDGGFVFTRAEFDDLSRILEGKPVRIDVTNPQRAIGALVEFGARQAPVQWSPQAWKTILGYRPWSAPKYDQRASFALVASEDGSIEGTVYETPRYKLDRLPD